MQQLTQQLKSGKMEILEVPFPALNKGQILVRNHYSVISAGTEGKTVTDARKGYIAKARSRQQEVKMLIDMIKTNGLLPTYKLVMNKLEAPSPLGYSSAGDVISVGKDVKNFKVGDKAACGGATAFHADVISVPSNLCVKVPEKVSLKHAAFTTISSIAIQGIRQAGLKFGENCVIIGLGLIGQLTIQILNASGVKAIGVDINENQVIAAKKSGAKFAYSRKQEGLDEIIYKLTDGYGTDAVIITAGTSSLDPIEFAGTIARKKGKVVIVGAVPTGFSRANYFKKELDLRMSSSYGPGRYDPLYEEKGIDYPIGYVRWTENRNMQSYIDLLEADKLEIDKIISHEFNLVNAPEAYNMILDKSKQFTGILIKYDIEKELKRDIILESKTYNSDEPNIGFIGAGNFAQGTLLPGMKNLCNFSAIATAQGNESIYVAKKYGFKSCFDSGDEVISFDNVNTVFIVTRHNTHFEFIIKALKAGKNIFVEKPLAMSESQLEEIKELYLSIHNDQKSSGPRLMVGYNRRFSPHIKKIKKLFLNEQQKAINIRVNAGNLPVDHWVNDPEIGGGRIIGEACHFIDLALHIAGSKITSVFANAMPDANNLCNTITINLKFQNGSIANISYFSNGSKKLPKEYIEVFCGETTVIIEDFKKMKIFGKNFSKLNLKGQDKGHKQELAEFIESIRNGKPIPIPFEELYNGALATLKTLESIKTQRVILL